MATELARKEKVNCFAVLLQKEQKWAEESIEQCHGGGERAFTSAGSRHGPNERSTRRNAIAHSTDLKGA